MNTAKQNRKVGYPKWVKPAEVGYYNPREYLTVKKFCNHRTGELYEAPLQTSGLWVKVPVNGSYTNLKGEKGHATNRQVWLPFTLERTPTGNLWELATDRPNLLIIPFNSYLIGSWKIRILEHGTGDCVDLELEYPLDIYCRTKRIQSFVEKAARGGNKVLRPKEDFLMWEHCLTTFWEDPDLMDKDTLNFVLQFMSEPLKTKLPKAKGAN